MGAAKNSIQTLFKRAISGSSSSSSRSNGIRFMCAVPEKTPTPTPTPTPSSTSSSSSSSCSSEELIKMEQQHSAHNYHPIPMVFSQAKGTSIWDPEGNRYIDFLSAYSAVNQGHCHPKVMKALVEQAGRLTLSSRAFYNDKFPIFAEYLTRIFGYEMVLPMNTGAEGVETALKLARKWGYEKKNIPKDEILFYLSDVTTNFLHFFLRGGTQFLLQGVTC